MKDKVFICYRREDTAAFAVMLHERLTEKLGTDRVFIDVDSIGPGIDFVDSIAKTIPVSALVLVLIGRRWNPARLADPRDFVRLELSAAFEQNARVIPLLFEGVPMPRSEELPAELAPLTRRNAVEIGTSRLNGEIRDFVEDIERMIAASSPPRQKSTGDQKKGGRIGLALFAGLLLIAVVAVAIGFLSRQRGNVAKTEETPRAAERQESGPETLRIGVTYRRRAFSENFMRERGLPDLGSGYEVTEIFPGGSAERAGLVKGDILRKIDGQPILDINDLSEQIKKHKAGDHILLEVWRGARATDIPIPIENEFTLYKRSCENGLAEGCVFLGFFYQDEGKDPARAAALYRQACEAGNGEGCLDLGILYEHGTGVTKDLAQAAAWYERACNARNTAGCVNLGGLFELGATGVRQDPSRAALFYQQACSNQGWPGCTNLGRLYAEGTGVAKDPARAALLYGQACDAGEAGGCNNLGVATYSGMGVDKDPSKAAVDYRVACAGGDNYGCKNLGNLYESGQGVQPDLKMAADFYDKGCNGNIGLACTDLGYLYRDGRGVEKDPSRALTLFQRACDLESPDGCSAAGLLYFNGKEVSQDIARAVALFKRACDGGSAVACNNLGVQYEFGGNGIDKDPARAAALFRQACDAKALIACRNLGSLYEKGLGVPRDPQKSADLYRQACSGGDSIACTHLNESKAR
ncbi:MAG TPA: TIR domain-containing protein [Thermoanaerobaculia bacterium]|jgi:hypothetical protein|nr:TIR domain-containing protein [Thermoanaerobaculia bacterium]